MLIFLFFGCDRNKYDSNSKNKFNKKVNLYLKEIRDDKTSEQNKIILNEKLFQLIKSSKNNNSLNRKILDSVIDNYYSFNEWQKYITTSKLLLKNSTLAKDTLYIAKALRYNGNYYYKNHVLDSSFYYYLKAEKYYLKLKDYDSYSIVLLKKGILQYDMWCKEPSDRYNWNYLKESIKTYGLRNSLLLAPMPTASTSQILGFNECFEPFTSNLYSRRTLAGEFIVINKYLMKELIDIGYWNEEIKNNIIANKGSVQQLTNLPEHIRNKYKIVWEIPMKHLIDMSADRGAFICQSQSLNLWIEDPNYNTLTSMHFYSWKKGLKTGIYYLRRKAKHQAQQFTIEPELKKQNAIEKDEICESCSA